MNIRKIIKEEIDDFGDWDWTKKAVPIEDQNPEEWVGKTFGYSQEMKDSFGHSGNVDGEEVFTINGIDVNGNLSLTKYHPIDGEYSDLGVTVKTLRDSISNGTWVWV